MLMYSILGVGRVEAGKNPSNITPQWCYVQDVAVMLHLVSFSQTTFIAHLSTDNAYLHQGLALIPAYAWKQVFMSVVKWLMYK